MNILSKNLAMKYDAYRGFPKKLADFNSILAKVQFEDWINSVYKANWTFKGIT